MLKLIASTGGALLHRHLGPGKTNYQFEINTYQLDNGREAVQRAFKTFFCPKCSSGVRMTHNKKNYCICKFEINTNQVGSGCEAVQRAL